MKLLSPIFKNNIGESRKKMITLKRLRSEYSEQVRSRSDIKEYLKIIKN